MPDYYPNETDIIRDSKEIAQLCLCHKTTWRVSRNQNQLLGDFCFSSEKLSHETPRRHEKPRKKEKKLTAKHQFSVKH